MFLKSRICRSSRMHVACFPYPLFKNKMLYSKFLIQYEFDDRIQFMVTIFFCFDHKRAFRNKVRSRSQVDMIADVLGQI